MKKLVKQQFIFYSNDNQQTIVDLFIQDETLWTTQKGMAEIFGVEVPAISKHISNIFEEQELERRATVSKMEIVRKEGNREVKRELEFYNLDVIISVGYRVNSYQATQFRIWATSVLKEYMTKGFALDDERLKQGNQIFGKDYFDELLERIREIRASERLFYQKITDIYAECSYDYDKNSPEAQTFFATVQNKLHWAIHGNTAAELIEQRADSKKPYMGLTSWKNQKNAGKILKNDVTIAKNYLSQEEISELNRVVTMYLDFAENTAKRRKVMSMTDWAKRLDSFLEFNEYDVLTNAGKVSKKVADSLAHVEYDKFRVIQDKNYRSDFDELLEEIKKR